MQLNFSYRYLFLALIIISSHLALVTHVFVHASPEIVSCDLCISQDQQSHAVLPTVNTTAATDLIHQHVVLVLSPSHSLSADHHYLQRAPPANA